jgi:predicted porin
MISMVGNSSGVRNTRSDGMIKWLGKVGPVDLILGYSAGGTAGNDNKSSWNGGAKVTYGPVTAAVATAALTDAAGKKMTVNGFGGRYAFGDFTVSAGRYTHENDAGYVGANLTTYGTYTGPVLGTAAATGPATESSVNALGVEYKVNPKLTTSLAVYRGTYENGLGKKGKLNSEVFLAEYAMSKRTSLYAFVDRADPSGDIASKTVTKDVIGYAVGIKHTF